MRTNTSSLGVGLINGGTRDWRLGWQLTPAMPDGSAFEVMRSTKPGTFRVLLDPFAALVIVLYAVYTVIAWVGL